MARGTKNSLKFLLRDFAEWTTIPGPIQIVYALNSLFRMLWVVIWLGLFGVFVYQVWVLLTFYNARFTSLYTSGFKYKCEIQKVNLNSDPGICQESGSQLYAISQVGNCGIVLGYVNTTLLQNTLCIVYPGCCIILSVSGIPDRPESYHISVGNPSLRQFHVKSKPFFIPTNLLQDKVTINPGPDFFFVQNIG